MQTPDKFPDLYTSISAAFNSHISFAKNGDELIKEADFTNVITDICDAVKPLLEAATLAERKRLIEQTKELIKAVTNTVVFDVKAGIAKIENAFNYKIDYDPNKKVYLLWYSNDPSRPAYGRIVTIDEIYTLAKDL
jgi:hypothetical protein